jgi:hypothetical protein
METKFKTEIERKWTEEVYPNIKSMEDKCRKLKIMFQWSCEIGDEVFGGDNTSAWRKQK